MLLVMIGKEKSLVIKVAFLAWYCPCIALTCQSWMIAIATRVKITKVDISHIVHFYWQTNCRICVCRPDAKGETVHEYMCDVNAGNRGQSVHDITDGHRAHIWIHYVALRILWDDMFHACDTSNRLMFISDVIDRRCLPRCGSSNLPQILSKGESLRKRRQKELKEMPDM